MRTYGPDNRRDGFALPVALLAIMVIGAIVTGGFYASSQESRISTSTDLGNQAFYVAEYGLEEAIGTWGNDNLTAVDTVATLDPEQVSSGGSNLGSYQLTVRRLSSQLYLVTSTGTVQAGRRTATREVGSLLRVTTAEPPYPSALAVYGGINVAGNAQIRGDDTGGPGCAPGDTVAGVTAIDSSYVTEQGKPGKIMGDPAIAVDSNLDTTGLSNFGSMNVQDLIDQANIIYPDGQRENGMGPSTTVDSAGNTVCNTNDSGNWGDPSGTGPCGDYMPIIHAQGDMRLQTGTGQGILIVEGDLRLTGNMDFYGLVIVKGSLFTAGTGNHIEGSVMVMGDGDLDTESTTTGNSLVQYSRCRVDRSFNSMLRPQPLSSRSWLDFTAITRGVADDN